MIMLKITIILFIVALIVNFIFKVCYGALDPLTRVFGNFPAHIYILLALTILLWLGFIGCLIATIILW